MKKESSLSQDLEKLGGWGKMETNDKYEYELLLEDIKPKNEEAIERWFRTSYLFPKVLLWLESKSEKLDFVLVSQLMKDLNLSNTQARNTLDKFGMAELLIKKKVGNKNEYWFIKGKGDKTLKKYISHAKKVLSN